MLNDQYDSFLNRLKTEMAVERAGHPFESIKHP